MSLSGSARAVPENCDEMATMIEALATATTVADRISIAKEILQSTITRCTDKTKLSTVKIKIREVKKKNGDVLVKIRLRIKTKRKKIKDNKNKLVVIQTWQILIQNPPKTQPPTSGIYLGLVRPSVRGNLGRNLKG